jgi:hypothetical protein
MGPLARIAPGVCLALAAILGGLVYAFVDLNPRVDDRFFFAPDSGAYREAKRSSRPSPTRNCSS